MSSEPKTILPFFLVSLSLHLLLLFGWPKPTKIDVPAGQIPVSFLPAIPNPPPQNQPAPKLPSDRKTTNTPLPAKTAKRTSVLEEKGMIPQTKEPNRDARENRKTERSLRDVRNSDLTSRPLPSLKQLLPPVTWSAPREGTGEEGPIRLDTREPRYLNYFESIKRAIEKVWEYPDIALQSGLEGKLILEFTVLENGALVGPRLVRSSGFLELDEEAIRAVRAASPFRPIPSSIGRNRIDILASFEYYDNRLRYHFTR